MDVGLLTGFSRAPCSLSRPSRPPGKAMAAATITDTQAAVWTSSGLEATITPKASQRMMTHPLATIPGGLRGDAYYLPPLHVRPAFCLGSRLAEGSVCVRLPQPRGVGQAWSGAFSSQHQPPRWKGCWLFFLTHVESLQR